MYQVLSISKILTSFSSTADNFDGIEYTDVVRKVENFMILPLFSYRLCNKSLQYNDILQTANLGQIFYHSGI